MSNIKPIYLVAAKPKSKEYIGPQYLIVYSNQDLAGLMNQKIEIEEVFEIGTNNILPKLLDDGLLKTMQ